ncbi:hypothetical protein EV11_0501 [Prochlorococcus sp. SS52]|nr:hypothetical protein EV04_1171 [Prochlorococcus marinus str. LG]KGG23219.1 hypothetical protein EV09_1967 [Prochlorococcus marinus str. SS35]KGG33930.1 hypothetical protein EV10_0369 [Prochlorococcus marinus str. SS51]KGG36721.1 hypothetical protein EV11_0501 [Prochlorococcus sp. SS52]
MITRRFSMDEFDIVVILQKIGLFGGCKRIHLIKRLFMLVH